MGVQIASKTRFPSMSLIGLVSSKNIASMFFVGIQNDKGTSVITVKNLIFLRMFGNIYVIIFTKMVFDYVKCHADP